MPTTNISVTASWTKIADAGESFLMTANFNDDIEVATTAADSAPTVRGHHLRIGVGGDALVRDVIGEGYVWVKLFFNKPGASLVVSK